MNSNSDDLFVWVECKDDPCYKTTCTWCMTLMCAICSHYYGDHYTSHDGRHEGCTWCNGCGGFQE